MKNMLFIVILLISLQSLAQRINENFESSKIHETKGIFTESVDSRIDNYEVKFYKLDIEISDKSKYISGNAIVDAQVVSSQLDTFVIELIDEMEIDSIIINNIKHNYIHQDDKIIVELNNPLEINDKFRVITYYKGTPVGGGVTNAHSSNWDKDVTWTLSESFHAKEWWPAKQVLSDKADSVYVFLTIPSNCKAGSIGLLDNITNMPDNKLRYEWKSKYPINYYLISFSVAEYQDYSIYTQPAGVSNPILIQNYIYDSPDCLSTYKEEIDASKDLINLYSDLFGTYPFKDEKYGHCLAEIGGGMEHQTMTTLGNFSFRLVSHEMAHQWFGDYVTCATWQDIWINEGFASYTEYLAKENLISQDAADEWIAYAHERALQEPEGSVYIPFEDARDESRIFNYNLSYKKGASIIHTLRHEINNDEIFFNILQSFLDEYADSVATGDDFLNTVNQISGTDYTNYFNQWYYGRGYPIFDLEWSQRNDTLKLQSTQRTSSNKTPLFQVHVDYKINFADSDTIVRIYQATNTEDISIPINKNIISIEIDPYNKILNTVGSINYLKLEDFNKTDFKIYPNPAKENIKIELSNANSNNYDIEIIKLDGTVIKHYNKIANNSIININKIKPGLYLIKLYSNEITLTKKLLKQ